MDQLKRLEIKRRWTAHGIHLPTQTNVGAAGMKETNFGRSRGVDGGPSQSHRIGKGMLIMYKLSMIFKLQIPKTRTMVAGAATDTKSIVIAIVTVTMNETKIEPVRRIEAVIVFTVTATVIAHQIATEDVAVSVQHHAIPKTAVTVPTTVREIDHAPIPATEIMTAHEIDNANAKIAIHDHKAPSLSQDRPCKKRNKSSRSRDAPAKRKFLPQALRPFRFPPAPEPSTSSKLADKFQMNRVNVVHRHPMSSLPQLPTKILTCKSVKRAVASAFSRMKNVANHWPKAKILLLLPIAASAAMTRQTPMVRIAHALTPMSPHCDWGDTKSFQILIIGRDINHFDSIYAKRMGAADRAESREGKGSEE